MTHRRRKPTRMPLAIVSVLLMLAFLAACSGSTTAGGGDQTAGGGEAAASGAEGEAAASEVAEASVDLNAAPVPTPEPTPLPDVQCTAEQKELIWMVRNNPTENPWEVNTVRPAFSEANPDICLKITSIRQEDIAVKRQAMLASGEPLHVWSPNWGGDGFQSDRVRGLLQDLTPLIEQDSFDTSVFIPEVLEIYQQEGKTWALPFLTTGSYVFYNKQIFDEAGVEYPPQDWNDPNWTWEAFVEMGKKLTKNVDPLDLNTAVFGISEACWPKPDCLPMMWGYKVYTDEAQETGFAESANVTDPKVVESFQARHDLIYKDKVSPDTASVAALDQLGGAFQSGRIAMEINGGWGWWSYKPLIDDEANGFCWGAAAIPRGAPDAEQRAVIFTDPWVITANLSPEEQATAWNFVKFLVSPEQAREYALVGGAPPTQSALLDEYFKQFEKCQDPAEARAVWEGGITNGRESSNHLLVRWDELDQIWVNNMPTLWDDPSATAQSMLDTIQPQINEALVRIKTEGGN